MYAILLELHLIYGRFHEDNARTTATPSFLLVSNMFYG